MSGVRTHHSLLITHHSEGLMLRRRQEPTLAVATAEQLQTTVQAIEREMAKVIVGQHDVVRGVLIGAIAGGHVLLEGVPGLGKTLIVRVLAGALDLQYSRIQFTPDLMP